MSEPLPPYLQPPKPLTAWEQWEKAWREADPEGAARADELYRKWK